MGFAAIDFATKAARGNASKRIIGVTIGEGDAAIHETGLLSEWAMQLAAKFSTPEKVLTAKNATVTLNNAIRAGVPAFGLQFTLVSGKPYAPPVARKSTKARKSKAKATEASSAVAAS